MTKKFLQETLDAIEKTNSKKVNQIADTLTRIKLVSDYLELEAGKLKAAFLELNPEEPVIIAETGLKVSVAQKSSTVWDNEAVLATLRELGKEDSFTAIVNIVDGKAKTVLDKSAYAAIGANKVSEPGSPYVSVSRLSKSDQVNLV